MSFYDNVGACGPVGCAAPAYAPYGPAAAAQGFAAPAGYPLAAFNGGFGGFYPQVDIMGQQAPAYATPDSMGQYGPYTQWDIVGQPATPATPATPAATPTLGQRVTDFLADAPLGTSNRNILIGAGILGLGTYGYYKGWFGGKKISRRRARDLAW